MQISYDQRRCRTWTAPILSCHAVLTLYFKGPYLDQSLSCPSQCGTICHLYTPSMGNSQRSDTYSFGIVVFEITSRRMVLDTSTSSVLLIVDRALMHVRSRHVEKVFDESLRGEEWRGLLLLGFCVPVWW